MKVEQSKVTNSTHIVFDEETRVLVFPPNKSGEVWVHIFDHEHRNEKHVALISEDGEPFKVVQEQ